MKNSIGSICLAAALLLPGYGNAQDPGTATLAIPIPDAERGRTLFASKGCVVCHSVNGVGGSAGPALDIVNEDESVDPLGFAARMWRGASAMAFLQSLELGYQITLTGQEIADLAAFVSIASEREAFSEADIPEVMRGWTIDEPFEPLDEMWDSTGIDSALQNFSVAPISNLTRGHMLTERWCTSCHVVDVNGEGGDAGPAFEAVAARPDVDEAHIQEWLSAPHEKMPEFIALNDTDISDIAAYIMSLKPE